MKSRDIEPTEIIRGASVDPKTFIRRKVESKSFNQGPNDKFEEAENEIPVADLPQ